MGRSSGGFGAITQAMHHPDLSARSPVTAATCTGNTPASDLSKMHQQLVQFGGLDAFVRDIPTIRPKNSAFWELIMAVCWSAAFGGTGQPTRVRPAIRSRYRRAG